jgi:hypothetical protein
VQTLLSKQTLFYVLGGRGAQQRYCIKITADRIQPQLSTDSLLAVKLGGAQQRYCIQITAGGIQPQLSTDSLLAAK